MSKVETFVLAKWWCWNVGNVLGCYMLFGHVRCYNTICWYMLQLWAGSSTDRVLALIDCGFWGEICWNNWNMLKHGSKMGWTWLNMLKQFAVSVPCADYIDYKWESWFSWSEMTPLHAGDMSAFVRIVCWFNSLFVFHIFHLDHLTSSCIRFTLLFPLFRDAVPIS